jgi:threonine dehydrogenase-like Zn-dependent dehydrogenase
MRNQAAVLYAPHDVRMEERPMPQLGPKDVLVEVKAVGVCGSDVHYYEHGRIGSHNNMSNEEGAMIEPLSVGLWACRKARLRGGDHVLITDAGPIGMLAMKVALQVLQATKQDPTNIKSIVVPQERED